MLVEVEVEVEVEVFGFSVGFQFFIRFSVGFR